MRSIVFESNSKLCKIGQDFLKNSLVKCISVPSQITIPGQIDIENFNFVEFLADEFQTDLTLYGECNTVISLPNCRKIQIEFVL